MRSSLWVYVHSQFEDTRSLARSLCRPIAPASVNVCAPILWKWVGTQPSPSLFPLAGNTLLPLSLSSQITSAGAKLSQTGFFCWRAHSLALLLTVSNRRDNSAAAGNVFVALITLKSRKKRAIKYRSELTFFSGWISLSAEGDWGLLFRFICYQSVCGLLCYFVARALNDHSTWLIRALKWCRQRYFLPNRITLNPRQTRCLKK